MMAAHRGGARHPNEPAANASPLLIESIPSAVKSLNPAQLSC